MDKREHFYRSRGRGSTTIEPHGNEIVNLPTATFKTMYGEGSIPKSQYGRGAAVPLGSKRGITVPERHSLTIPEASLQSRLPTSSLSVSSLETAKRTTSKLPVPQASVIRCARGWENTFIDRYDPNTSSNQNIPTSSLSSYGDGRQVDRRTPTTRSSKNNIPHSSLTTCYDQQQKRCDQSIPSSSFVTQYSEPQVTRTPTLHNVRKSDNDGEQYTRRDSSRGGGRDNIPKSSFGSHSHNFNRGQGTPISSIIIRPKRGRGCSSREITENIPSLARQQPLDFSSRSRGRGSRM